VRVAGLCTVCGGLARPAFTCGMCGIIVCRKCFNEDLGLCMRCATQSRKIF
jgi:hypothetical protein